MKKEKACGCIIIEDNKVLLVYESKRKFWGFPKGHVEEGETEIETAKREVLEETGLNVIVDESRRYEIKYMIGENLDIEKTAVFFMAKVKDGKLQKQEEEIEDMGWFTFEEAKETLSYYDLKGVLEKAIKDI